MDIFKRTKEAMTKKMVNFIHYRRLRFDIILSFLSLFLLSFFFILSYMYDGNKRTNINFAQQILKEVTEANLERLHHYLSDAKSASSFITSLVDVEKPDFLQDPKLHKNFMRVLEIYPYFNVAQIGLANGDYLSIERVQPGTKYVTTPDKPLQDNIVFLSHYQNRHKKDGPPQEFWTYFDKDGKVVSKEVNEFLVYDPRKRPWYISTDQKRRFNWAPVYIFSFLEIPGITAATPLFQKDDHQEKMIGVVGIDVSLKEISKFLEQNIISQNEISFILNQNEQLVASSDPQNMIPKNSNDEIQHISKIEVKSLKDAYELYKKNNNPLFKFRNEKTSYISSFLKLDDESNEFWTIGTVVPMNDFLIETTNIRDRVTWIIFIVVGISCLLILLLSQRISRPILSLVEETERIQNLDIKGDLTLKSSVLEIQMMINAITSMRNSLLSFSKFVPKSLVKKLLQKGGEIRLGGRKKDLTIFFSDIIGFSAISENIPPEKLVSHLSTYFDELSNILTTSNGTIDKYIGDGIMAFWGAPLHDRDQTFNACHSALQCQKRLGELNRLWELEGQPIFRTRIGIHRDDVLVGIIGSEEKMNYTIMGDGVNLASRLEGLNKYYHTGITISQNVYDHVEGHFLVRPLDVIAVKGKTKAVKIFELVAQNKGDPSLLPSEDDRHLCDLFTKAFRFYTLQKWEDALEHFQHIHTLYPQDYPTQIYIERCLNFQKEPPSKDWDGVTLFK